MLFVNGIPVVVMECKSPFLEQSKNEKMGKHEAYEQLLRYIDARGSEKDVCYGIVMPDTPAYRQQTSHAQAWVRKALNLHWLFVSEDGSIEVVAP